MIHYEHIKIAIINSLETYHEEKHYAVYIWPSTRPQLIALYSTMTETHTHT